MPERVTRSSPSGLRLPTRLLRAEALLERKTQATGRAVRLGWVGPTPMLNGCTPVREEENVQQEAQDQGAVVGVLQHAEVRGALGRRRHGAQMRQGEV